MKVEQFPYLSPEANALRRRDGTPPWGVHPCEVDSLASGDADRRAGPFHAAWREAKRIREQLERETD